MRRRLSRAALGLYRARGYDAVTMRDVGAAAGVSRSTPYGYFDSKDELFLYVRAEVFREFGEYLRSKDPVGLDPRGRLRHIVMALADFGRESPEDYRLIFSTRQAPAPPESVLAQAQQQVFDYVVSLFQLAIDAGQLTGDAITQAHLAWASVHGLLALQVSNLLVNGRQLEDLLVPMINRVFAHNSESESLPARPLYEVRSRSKVKAPAHPSTRSRRSPWTANT